VYQKFSTPTHVQNCRLIQNLPFRINSPNWTPGNDLEGNRILYMNAQEEPKHLDKCSPTLIYNINRRSLILRFHTIYENATKHYAFHGGTYGLQYNIQLNVPAPVVTNGPVPVLNIHRFLPSHWQQIENALKAMDISKFAIEAIATIIHNEGIIIPTLEDILHDSQFEYQTSKNAKAVRNTTGNNNNNADDDWEPTNMED
jgi:hypothetical protein